MKLFSNLFSILKNTKVTLMLSILFPIITFAQADWYYQTPTSVFDVYFTGNSTMIAAGKGVWKSTDRGESWKGAFVDYPLNDGIMTNPLKKVDFSGTLIGYAVGSKGKMIKTVDGGNNWDVVDHNIDEENTLFVDVAILSYDVCIAVAQTYNGNDFGTQIIKTTDGGSTWATVYWESGLFMNDMDFPDDQNGWITGNYRQILRTTDAGSTWAKMELPSSLGAPTSYSIDFIDADNGLISIQNAEYVVRTTNGGSNWEVINTGITGFTRCIQYFSLGTAYMITDAGIVYKSVDDGSNWSQLSVLPENWYNRIAFDNTSVGISFGAGNSNFSYAVTINSSQDWESFNVDPGIIYSYDQNNSWVLNANYPGFLRTSNGETWKIVKPNSSYQNVSWFGPFKFFNPDEGYASLAYETAPYNYSYALVKTNDGGENWSEVMATSSSYFLFDFPNKQYGWVVLENGHILKTLDYGATWGQQVGSAGSYPTDVQFVDENNGWICGWYGVFLRTTNGGLLWDAVSIAGYTGASFDGVCFYDAVNGYLIGRINANEGIVLKTNDGGLTWTDITPIELTSFLYRSQLDIDGPTTVYLSVGNGKILRTGDAGFSWQTIQFPELEPAGAISVINNDRIYMVGYGIMNTKNAGITSVEEDGKTDLVPNNFSLSQNYPNPFNPSTQINYSIPESGNVKLIIYDMLGREVKTILDQFQNAGSYSIDFKAEGLSSGVYFYRLSDGKISQINKMIILK